jgi:phage terminase large subunit
MQRKKLLPKFNPIDKFELPKKKAGRPKKDGGPVIQTTTIFDWNRQAEEQIIINRGGRGSSKSYSIAQLMVETFFTIPDVKILILRKTQPSLRQSVIPLIINTIKKYELWGSVTESKRDDNLFSPVNGVIHFGGLDDPEKVKSSDWNIIWMEEANEFTYSDFVNLKMLLRAPTKPGFRNRMFLSFNPVSEYSWLKEKLIDNNSEDKIEIHSTYIHNPFLSDDYVRTIRSLIDQNKNFYRIFALGEWGRLDHLVYSNWMPIPYLPEGSKLWGLDFGFSNPSALVEIIVDGRDLSVAEKLYEKGLTTTKLIERLEVIIPENERGSYPIIADRAEPDKIKEINEAGFWCMPADKAVKAGIDYLKTCRIKIKEDSDHLLREIKGYSYKTDKDDHPIEEPCKFEDHLLDALRYGVWTYHQQGRDNSIGFIKVI